MPDLDQSEAIEAGRVGVAQDGVERPLAGLRIVVTRPEERGAGLAASLRDLGASVLVVPAIAFRLPEDVATLDAALGSLSQYDWVVFTSATAAEFCLWRLAALGHGPKALQGPRLAAVGPATAHALRRRGLNVHHTPDQHTGAALATDLAQLTRGRRVLLPRGDIADPALPLTLRSAGAQVQEAITYRTVVPGDLAPRLAAAVAGGVDLICFHSPSAVHNVVAALERGGLYPWSGPVAVIGPTTLQAAREAGLIVAVEAQESSNAGLMEAVRRWWGEEGRKDGHHS